MSVAWRVAVEAARDVVLGGAQVLAVALVSPLVRRRYNRAGASDAEVRAAMPGDGLVPSPRLGYTRARTIDAPPASVWPWLAQMGQGRAGLYSYDGLENLVGCRISTLRRLVPELQNLSVGDLVRLGPAGYPCFRVTDVLPPTALVLVGADPAPPHAAATADSPGGTSTWQWLLVPAEGGRRTRVVVRQRLTFPPVWAMRLLWRVVEPVAFVMERRMLGTIATLAERDARVGPVASRSHS
jgi:hypothetical protein